MPSAFALPWWGVALVGLFSTHLVIALVTVYFHRASAHRAVLLAPPLERVCRFLAWFMIAMDPQEFAAVHRKHHATCDTPDDPHSPVHYGVWTVLFQGLRLYRAQAKNAETIARYGQGLPVDPWEAFYRRYPNAGVLAFGVLLVALFGGAGAVLWGAHMVWIPFWAAGVVNGLGHHVGYRSFQTEDHSTNLLPIGVWIGGEELHNNHHAEPSSPKFSKKPFEFDVGWAYIQALRSLGWARLRTDPGAHPPRHGMPGVLSDRYRWLLAFQASLPSDVLARASAHGFATWRDLSRAWDRREALSASARARLEHALADPMIAAMHELETGLRSLWQERRLAAGQAQEAFHDWVLRVRSHRLPTLDDFCDRLLGPVAQPVAS